MILVSILVKVLIKLIFAVLGPKLVLAIFAVSLGVRAALVGLKHAAAWLRAAWQRATRGGKPRGTLDAK